MVDKCYADCMEYKELLEEILPIACSQCSEEKEDK